MTYCFAEWKRYLIFAAQFRINDRLLEFAIFVSDDCLFASNRFFFFALSASISYECSMRVRWVFRAGSMSTVWVLWEYPWPLGDLWVTYGWPMGDLWVTYGWPMGDLWATYGIAPMKVRQKREMVWVFRTRIQRRIYQLIRYNYYIFFGIRIIQYLCPQKIVRRNTQTEHRRQETNTDITSRQVLT